MVSLVTQRGSLKCLLESEASRDAIIDFYPNRQLTTLLLKPEKVQKDKQRSTKHTHKTKDQVTRTPLKTRVNSSVPEG
jgi:hypothetical protein